MPIHCHRMGSHTSSFSVWPHIFSLPAAATADAPSMSTRNQGTQGTMHCKQTSCCNVCNASVPALPLPPARHTLMPSAMAVDLPPPAPPATALEGKVSTLCGSLWPLHADVPSMSTRNQVLRVPHAASRHHVTMYAMCLHHHHCCRLLLNTHQRYQLWQSTCCCLHLL
jgi:uncharacterized protein YbdZ (MbtH family)